MTAAHVSDEAPERSRGSRFSEISSTWTPSRNAILTTSAATEGSSARVGVSETAAVARSPVPKPVSLALAGSIVNSSGCSSK